MKSIAQITTLAVVVLAMALVIGWFRYRDMPAIWYDGQGTEIVNVIESEFVIPHDSMSDRESIYTSGWAYRRRGVWNTGSQIIVYGVKDPDLQNRMIGRIEELVKLGNYWDIRITFFEHSQYRVEGDVVTRIDVPELRSERIIGKTASYLDANNTLRAGQDEGLRTQE